MKTLFLILALAGSVNAMPGCTTGGAPLYLQIPTLGASGDQFANCLAYDFAFISTATPLGINFGSTQTWTGANTFTSTANVYSGNFVSIITPQTSAASTQYGISVLSSGTTNGMYGGPVGITAHAYQEGGQHKTTIGVNALAEGAGALDIGVKGVAQSSGAAVATGVYGYASDGAAGAVSTLYGVEGLAQGIFGNVNPAIGVYGTATGGTVNYAGYFDGDVYSTGTVTATSFYGSGAYLTNVPAASIATGSLGSGVALSVSSTSINMAVSSAAATEIFTLTHGLGTVPTHQTVVLVCLVSTDGYTTGDEIDNFVHVGTIYKNSTAVTFYSGDGSQTGYLTVDGQNTWVNMKTRYSNWAVKIRAWK